MIWFIIFKIVLVGVYWWIDCKIVGEKKVSELGDNGSLE